MKRALIALVLVSFFGHIKRAANWEQKHFRNFFHCMWNDKPVKGCKCDKQWSKGGS